MTVAEYPVGREQVQDIERTLSDLNAITGEVKLNFTNHWADDGYSSALLAAALIGPLSDRHLVVDAEDDATVDSLVRFGVATALSRRPKSLTTFVGPVTRLDRDRLRLLWTPGARGATASMFGVGGEDLSGGYGPRHATFVNPHLSSGPDGFPDVVYLVRRWLTRRLDSPSLAHAVATVALVVGELIQNVQEHAAGPEVREPDCLMRLSLASDDHVRVSVLDTGIGLDRSLAAKAGHRLQASRRLQELLGGRLPGWDAGRGIGLARVATEVVQGGGHLSVATDALRATHTSAGTVVDDSGFPLRGTVVDCTIRLPA